MRISRILTAGAVAALLLLFAACGDDSGKTTSAGSTSSSSASAAADSTTSSTAAPATGSAKTPVSVAPTHPIAHLVAVRAARQDTVDRVVFEFKEQVPGYKVSYMPKPIMGTSGKEVTVAGSTALVVRMEQASGFNLDAGQPTYTGPKTMEPPGTRLVKGVAQVEDFEAVLSWVIGVDAEAPFRVSTLTSPPRLVIDIAS